MPFLAAQSAMGTVACGSVKLVRTMYGDCSVIIDVAAAVTTIGVLLCVASGAVARASGVRPKPASTSTFSLTTSSCAMRRVVSATPASSFTITSIVRPATLLPFCARKSLTAASSCLPVDADCPVMGRMKPILNGLPCACAPVAAVSGSPAASARAATRRKVERFVFMVFLSPVRKRRGRGSTLSSMPALAYQVGPRDALHRLVALQRLDQVLVRIARMLAHDRLGTRALAAPDGVEQRAVLRLRHHQRIARARAQRAREHEAVGRREGQRLHPLELPREQLTARHL